MNNSNTIVAPMAEIFLGQSFFSCNGNEELNKLAQNQTDMLLSSIFP
jgi:hypothetical protein